MSAKIQGFQTFIFQKIYCVAKVTAPQVLSSNISAQLLSIPMESLPRGLKVISEAKQQ